MHTYTFPHEHLPHVATPAPENPAPERQPGTMGTAVQELCNPTDLHADLSSTIYACALYPQAVSPMSSVPHPLNEDQADGNNLSMCDQRRKLLSKGTVREQGINSGSNYYHPSHFRIEAPTLPPREDINKSQASTHISGLKPSFLSLCKAVHTDPTSLHFKCRISYSIKKTKNSNCFNKRL